MSAAIAQGADAVDRRVITVVVLMACFMQAASISLPNAALLHIQGELSMADDEVGWIFTSYLTASLVTMPMTRWLAGRFGRKMVYLVSLAVFSFGLLLATWATTPLQFVGARIIQGAASGPIGPLSIAIMLDILPAPRHARINLVWTVTLITGLLSGAGIGGWLSEYHGWHALFYVSLPLTAFIFLALALTLPEKKPAQNPEFDFFGLATFSLGIVGLQMLLDRGERVEWFNSTESWAEAIAAGLGFYLYLVHVLTTDVHFLNKGLFRDRNFVLSTIIYFAVGFVLLPTVALTLPMLDEILNYPADTTGYLTLPRTAALVGSLILAARAPAWIDTKLLLVGGISLVVYANCRMLGYSPEMYWPTVVIAGMIQGAGLGILMPALTKTAFSTLDPALRPEGTALFNLARLYGATIGIAVVLTFFYGNTQAMHLALAKDLSPFRGVAHVSGLIAPSGLASWNDMITGQAAFVAIIGQFKVMMIPLLVVSPLVLLLRKPHPQGI